MPRFSVEIGKRYRITVEGYVASNLAGWITLVPEKQDLASLPGQTGMVQIMEPMIVGDPEITFGPHDHTFDEVSEDLAGVDRDPLIAHLREEHGWPVGKNHDIQDLANKHAATHYISALERGVL